MRRQLLLTLFTAAALSLSAADRAREVQLQQALDLMQTKGDLSGAIKLLEEVVKTADRNLAARSLLYLGDCRQKLGQQEASKPYERVVREFGDQREVAAEAKARLAAIKQPAATRSGIVARQVWAGPKVDTEGTLSGDGRYLSYTDWSVNELGLHDLSTGTDRLVTKKDASASSADYPEESAVSRDGKMAAVAWFSISAGRYELRLVDLTARTAGMPKSLFTNEEVSWIAPYDWNADGTLIAVQLQRKDRTAQIGVVSVPEGRLRVLKSVEWRGASKLAFSPDGKRLAYDLPAGEGTDQRDIFLLATDASKETPLSIHPADETVIAWTPDGKHLLFSSDRTGSKGLWAMPIADGKVLASPRLIQLNIGEAVGLGLSASGTLVLGRTSRAQDIEIATIDFPGGKLVSAPEKPVQQFVGANRDPSFSPDGKYLAYQSLRGRSALVLSIQSLETGVARDLRPHLSYFNQPAWSPDGSMLAFRGRDNKGRDGLYTIDVRTGTVALVLTNEAGPGAARPIWSPDGKTMFYRKGSAIKSRDLQSGAERVIYTATNAAQPQISPDGKNLVMITDQTRRGLTILPLDGSGPRELIRLEGEGQFRSLAWAPDGGSVIGTKISGGAADPRVEFWKIPVRGGAPQKVEMQKISVRGDFSVHPDGRRIAFTSGERESEVWAIENFLPSLQASK